MRIEFQKRIEDRISKKGSSIEKKGSSIEKKKVVHFTLSKDACVVYAITRAKMMNIFVWESIVVVDNEDFKYEIKGIYDESNRMYSWQVRGPSM